MKTFTYSQRIALIYIISGIVVCCGCVVKEQPPYFSAQVLDLWNQRLDVENFRILYYWEERGETPFLKPYSYHAKEFILEIMEPLPGDARRVTIVTKKVPLQDILWFEVARGEVENTLKIMLKNNSEIIATDRFPQTLKKGEKTGFADHATYMVGTVVKDGKREAFKQELGKIKKATIVGVAEQLK